MEFNNNCINSNNLNNSNNSNNDNICNCCKSRSKTKDNKNLKCKKCDASINKLIGTAKICNKCHAKKSKEYYINKIQPTKTYIIKHVYDKLYVNEKGKEITLQITNDKKKCRLCETEKMFYDFKFISGGLKDKKTLSAECKQCYNLIQINKKKLIRELNIKSTVINLDNEIANNNNSYINQIIAF